MISVVVDEMIRISAGSHEHCDMSQDNAGIGCRASAVNRASPVILPPLRHLPVPFLNDGMLSERSYKQ